MGWFGDELFLIQILKSSFHLFIFDRRRSSNISLTCFPEEKNGVAAARSRGGVGGEKPCFISIQGQTNTSSHRVAPPSPEELPHGSGCTCTLMIQAPEMKDAQR